MESIRKFLASGDPGDVEQLQAETARIVEAYDSLAATFRQVQQILQRHPTRPDLVVAEADMILFSAFPQE